MSSSESDEEGTIVVIDNGSYVVKGGLAGNKTATAHFRSLIGKPKYLEIFPSEASKNYIVGDKVLQLADSLWQCSPLQRGIVVDWDAMETVWRHLLVNELRVDPCDSRICLIEHSFNNKCNREKTAETMFETFNVQGLNISNAAVLSLYASGRVTGVIMDCGQGITHVVPVFEGFPIYHAMGRIEWAGQDITAYLQRMLCEQGYSFQTPAEIDIVRQIKEEEGYVSLDVRKELANPDVKIYQLSNGNQIHLGKERFLCYESLFEPQLVGMDFLGIHELLHNAITKSDIDTRRELYSNIILTGGTTFAKGFPQRVMNEVVSLSPQNVNVEVIAPPERKKSAWLGGSIVCSLSSSYKIWTTKQEYDEFGPAIVHKKCV